MKHHITSRIVALTLVVTSGSAFVVDPSFARGSTAVHSNHKHSTEIDEMCVENAAAYCVENDLAEGCDLEEREALLNTLQEQRDFHLDEIQILNDLVRKLRGTETWQSAEHKPVPIRQHHVSEIDEMCIENAAKYCLQMEESDGSGSGIGECDVEEYEALVTSLQEQNEYHLEKVEEINSLVGGLGVLTP